MFYDFIQSYAIFLGIDRQNRPFSASGRELGPDPIAQFAWLDGILSFPWVG
jgi:hypothetical protein